MLNLNQLRVLAVLARHESVTETARELHYSQPSVSHHLARLEAATGAKLVQRVGRGIRLTPEGRLLANRATEIVGRVDAATAELAAQVGLQAGHVRLAANASTLSTIVPRTAERTMWSSPGFWLYDSTQVVVETPTAELRITQPREVQIYVKVFNELSGMAVVGAGARNLIMAAIDSLGL